MTRIGMNPARDRIGDYRPARVTVAVLVYLPYLEGYFRHRLDVLRLCLGSLLHNTRQPYDLFVFDNGSCEEAKAYLQSLVEAGAIRYLLSASQNIGKIGALQILFRSAPGKVIAYCDDDIFFYPGWLEAHLEILDGFPRVGMVSGCAVRTLFDHGIQSNLRLAEDDPDTELHRGQFIPQDWEREWAVSYGRDPEAHRLAMRKMEDFFLERRGLKAYGVANHNQFLTPKSAILDFLPEDWSGRLMGEMVELDNRVAEGGYLRLSTFERTTQHMGNMVSPDMAHRAAQMGIDLQDVRISHVRLPRESLIRRMARWKLLRWLLYGIYNRLFWILSQQAGTWLEKGAEDRS